MSEELKIQFGYERILFIPSNSQANKPNSELVPVNDRIKMLELSLEKNSSLVDLCEIERGGISYMIDTVNSIKAKYSISGRVGLFIGDDLIEGLSKWHNVDKLLEVVDIVVAHRESKFQLTTNIVHSYLNNKSINISSTDIRNRIKTGKAFRYLVPENVYAYIIEKDLYR